MRTTLRVQTGWVALLAAGLGWFALAGPAELPDAGRLSSHLADAPRSFMVTGIVQNLHPATRIMQVRHAEVPGYMPAMSMPFKVKEGDEIRDLQVNDEITFRLLVTDTESWVDHVSKTGKLATLPAKPLLPEVRPEETAKARNPLAHYRFTNELGQAVSLADFQGQALAITFIFTRCPVPEYCPRLSKNFEEASRKLRDMPQAATNWHFLSVSFDPAFDTPEVLKAYAQRYHYDPAHWSFLTGPPDKIAELARLSGVDYRQAGQLFDHGFRTLIIDAGNRLQDTIPVAGDLSEAIVGAVLKAAAAPREPASEVLR